MEHNSCPHTAGAFLFQLYAQVQVAEQRWRFESSAALARSQQTVAGSRRDNSWRLAGWTAKENGPGEAGSGTEVCVRAP